MKNIAFAERTAAFDVNAVRRQFPILARMVRGKPLAYLDNGASAQRPAAVIDAVDDYERHHHANIHRGVHTLSQEATALYENARDRLVEFINARSRHEVIFVRGTTEAVNLVAQSYARPILEPGDEILITHLEHHANIVPWQVVCEQTGAKLIVAPIDARGEVHVDAVVSLMGPRTRLFACAHVSNALGTVLPIRRLIGAAKARGIVTLIDGAQAVAHMPVDVQDLGCDFYAFSGHKMFGPTGIGVLYGREQLLERMPPWQTGGEMILAVTFAKTTYNGLPNKFEAGTPNISGAIGLGAAVGFLQGLDRDAAERHENALLDYATASIEQDTGNAHRGYGAGQGEPGLVRGRRRASSRSRNDSRRGRYRRSDRASLRHAGHGVLQAACDGARLVRHLQHLRGNRQACRRRRTRAPAVRLKSPWNSTSCTAT